jgi:hypothetical protein
MQAPQLEEHMKWEVSYAKTPEGGGMAAWVTLPPPACDLIAAGLLQVRAADFPAHIEKNESDGA